jgi:hypothetical protein
MDKKTEALTDAVAASVAKVVGQTLSPVLSLLAKVEAVWEQRLVADKAAKEVPVVVQVARQFKQSADGKWLDPQNTEEVVAVHRYVTQPAVVGCELGSTLNMGNYESARISVTVTVPCYREEVDSAFEWAKDFVEERYKKEVAEARSAAAALKKGDAAF